MRILYLVVGVLALALLFGIAITVLHPPAVSGVVAFSSRFLGYTNDAAGARLAVFQISNTSPQCVEWEPGYEFQKTGWSQGQLVLFTNAVHGYGLLLPACKSQILSVPSAPVPWRLRIAYTQHENRFQEFSRDVRLGLQKLGVPAKVPTRRGHVFYSEEVSP